MGECIEDWVLTGEPGVSKLVEGGVEGRPAEARERLKWKARRAAAEAEGGGDGAREPRQAGGGCVEACVPGC